MAHLVIGVVAAVAMLVAGALTTAAQEALLTAGHARIRQLAAAGDRRAARADALHANPQALLGRAQLARAIFSTGFAAAVTVVVYRPWVLALRQAGTPAWVAALITLLVVVVLGGVIVVVVAGVLPRSLAARYPERIALGLAGPASALLWLLRPVAAIAAGATTVLVRPFAEPVGASSPAVNEEELRMLVEAGEEQGVLEAEETEMIHSILEFGDTIVRKVMTPRIDIVAAADTAGIDELIAVARESGHSRLPIYSGELDNVVGVLHVKDLLAYAGAGAKEPPELRTLLREPWFVPETKHVGDLLTEFRRARQRIAIVRDEYGVTAGLITLEDLIEEIVGEIHDEYDEEEPEYQVVDVHTALADGRMSLEDLSERLGTELPVEDADTVGGFVFGLLGHQAEAGEEVAWNGYRFRVEATDGRRVQSVRIRMPDSQEAAGESVPQE